MQELSIDLLFFFFVQDLVLKFTKESSLLQQSCLKSNRMPHKKKSLVFYGVIINQMFSSDGNVLWAFSGRRKLGTHTVT